MSNLTTLPAAVDSPRGRIHVPEPLRAPDPRRSDDELIAYMLIRIWALMTGRSMRRDVSPDRLSEDELIDFWADPLIEQEGRT